MKTAIAILLPVRGVEPLVDHRGVEATYAFDPTESERHHGVDLLVDRHGRRIDTDGVRGALQRRTGASRVRMISRFDLARNLVQVALPAACGFLGLAALGAGLHVGGEKHLEVGVGQHDGSDVASVHHRARASCDGALPLEHRGTNFRNGAHTRHVRRDLGRTNGLADVLCVQPHAVLLDAHVGCRRQSRHLLNVVGVDCTALRREGDGTIQSAGVQVSRPQPRRDTTRGGALSRACRTVDRHDESGSGLTSRRESRRQAVALASAKREEFFRRLVADHTRPFVWR